MPLIVPKSTTHFSEHHRIGILLDLKKGDYLELNQIATLMWSVGTTSTDLSTCLAHLEELIDADRGLILSGLISLMEELAHAGLIEGVTHDET